jgi:hypothetical protein
MSRAIRIGVLVAGLAGTAVYTAPSCCRLISSARAAANYLEDLNAAGTSLNPVERIVFSLVLANSQTPQAQAQPAAGAKRI